jgi:hypothetical protein
LASFDETATPLGGLRPPGAEKGKELLWPDLKATDLKLSLDQRRDD